MAVYVKFDEYPVKNTQMKFLDYSWFALSLLIACLINGFQVEKITYCTVLFCLLSKESYDLQK